ncbi:M14 family metallopeptidase [Bacillus sp. FJAT-50051]|uniref:M14 family metallopeptidase n=2 Tax=Neobacillus citreus TaxID=2833578 RepID=A0A942T529_9BACI|nr:M14 family metallopeptidase [Neobacillus citreus]
MNNILAIWTKDGLLRDKNGDGVVDGVSVFIDLPEGLAPEGLIDFSARLGFETTSLSFTFFEPSEEAVNIRFVGSSSKTEARWENEEIIFSYKNESELSLLLQLLAAMKPEAGMDSPVVELRDGHLYAGTDLIAVNWGWEEGTQTGAESEPKVYSDIHSLSHLWSFSGFGKNQEASPSKLLNLNISVEKPFMTTSVLPEICHFAARAAMYSTSIIFPITGNQAARFQFDIKEGSDAAVLELLEANQLRLTGKREALPAALNELAKAKHWSEGGAFGYWEQEYLLSQKKEAPLLFESVWSGEREVDLAFKVLEASKNLEAVNVEIFLSEPLEVRNRLVAEWKAIFPAIHSLSIRSAFKPGFHWMMEEVLPSLQTAGETITKMDIYVREEQGEMGLELPIRWIQELYPVDRCLEEKLGLKADCVHFKLVKDLDHTYEVHIWNEKEEKQLAGCLDVPVSKLLYLDHQRYVYPVSSVVRISGDGGREEEHLIQTDRERFYCYYVEEVLPKLRKEVSKYNPGQGRNRPLFDRIEIDVWMSEEEQKLGVDEERISSLEALHEDLYFNTLDYFAYMGEELEGKSFDAPGGVHPFMHVRVGEKPEAQIRVYKWEDKPLENLVTKAIFFTEDGRFSEAVITNGEVVVNLEIKEFEKPTEHIHPDVQQWLNTSSPYRVVYPDHSYLGKAIPVIECFLDAGEEFYSPLKMSLFKKTVFIEAGHHSNEVSSTPAILQFINRAVAEYENWLKEVNVVILPLANPDGYELLTKLTEEHPEWKHHAARYNAVGLEYSLVRFHETVFGEANIYPEVLKRWAPDVIIDDHGIPSHEWVQPFAGYNSPPRFPVSYFLPSAKIYGIARLSNGEYRTLHEDNVDKIVCQVSSRIRGTLIEEENGYWQGRFIKYGNQWLPNVFPIEEAPGIHFYRSASVAPSYRTIGISRYPEWIAAEIISETADEVIYGEVLQSCVEAHIVFDLAILEALQKAEIEVKRDDRNGFCLERNRPIRL